jgi:hypothetical protein
MFSIPRPSPETTAKIRATLAIAFTAFLGGAGTYIETQVVGGIPPETQWTHIGVAALLVGLGAAWHRIQPTPSAAASVARKVALVGTMMLFVLVVACGAFGGVIAPSVSLGECVVQVGRAQTYADFPAFFAAEWKACGGLVEQDAIALLNAIVQSVDPAVAQYASQAKAHLADPEARAALVGYAKANAGTK